MIDRIPELVNSDANLVWRGRYLSTTFMLEIGDRGHLVKIHEGRVVSITPGPFVTPNYSFALRAPREEWETFWQQMPPPGYSDIFALFKRGKLRIEGDLHPFMANLLYLKDVLVAPRKIASGAQSSAGSATAKPSAPSFEPIVGRYLNLELLGRPHRLYIEEAGQGIPLLCLHTAGSDGRQYRGLLNDKRVTDHFRVIVFDMPWHGKSSPPEGWQKKDYRLTTDAYVAMIMGFARALGLERPVVMGCSIGGRIVLELALRHLAVRDSDARLGQKGLELRLAVLDRFDFVVQKVTLATALEFTQQGRHATGGMEIFHIVCARGF